MENRLSATKISYEAGKRPTKTQRSGSGNYCCVPNCKSKQYNMKIARLKLKQPLFFFVF